MLTAKTVSQETSLAEDQLAKRLNAEKIDPKDVETVTGAHPEGHKRGGVVAVVVEGEARVFYDETAREWSPYDD